MGSDIFHMHVLIFWSQLFPLDIFETEVKIYYGDHLCFFVCLFVCPVSLAQRSSAVTVDTLLVHTLS